MIFNFSCESVQIIKWFFKTIINKKKKKDTKCPQRIDMDTRIDRCVIHSQFDRSGSIILQKGDSL